MDAITLIKKCTSLEALRVCWQENKTAWATLPPDEKRALIAERSRLAAALTGTRGISPPARPPNQNGERLADGSPAKPCYVCRGVHFWRLSDGPWGCVACHPPAIEPNERALVGESAMRRCCEITALLDADMGADLGPVRCLELTREAAILWDSIPNL